MENCEFSKVRLTVLGQVLHAHGITADPEKTEALARMPPPGNVAELRRSLRMVKHLTKYLRGITEKMEPLLEILQSDATWSSDQQHEKAFRDVKADLSQCKP